MRTRIAALAVTISVIVAGSAWGAPTVGPCEAGDAGGTPATAAPIETPVACVGTLGMGDGDFYRFEVASGNTIAIRITPSHGTTMHATLTDPAGNDRSSACASLTCTVSGAQPGAWILGIGFQAGTAGRYALNIALAQQAPDVSCESDGDAPGSSGGARPVTPPMACRSALSPAGDADWWSFSAGEGDWIVTTLTRVSGGTVTLTLIGPRGVRSCTNSTSSLCSVTNAEAGLWQVGVRGISASVAAEYAFTLVTTPRQDPVPAVCEPQDAGSTEDQATVLAPISACTARISDAADVDVFAFEVEGAQTDQVAIAVAVAPLSGTEYELILTDPDGVSLPCTRQRAAFCSARRADAVGRWHVTIRRGAPGAYALSVVAVNPSPAAVQATIERTAAEAVGSLSCEPADAAEDPPGTLPWTSPTETYSICRGTLGDTDPADSFAFRVHSDRATVRVVLQPEDQASDLTLSLTPPAGACPPSTHVEGRCPSATSQIGRHGQPDEAEWTASAGAKSGDWIVRAGVADVAGPYTLTVYVQPG